jgi:hypothetical protein
MRKKQAYSLLRKNIKTLSRSNWNWNMMGTRFIAIMTDAWILSVRNGTRSRYTKKDERICEK